jgi:hypothetical protein
MKHLKLFEDFKYDELAKEAEKYKQIKDLPTDGNADIGEQFEVIAWKMALDRAGYIALSKSDKVAHIRWSTTKNEYGQDRKVYGVRGDVPDFLDKHHLRDNYKKHTCQFEDYFEVLPRYHGYKAGKKFSL